MLSFDKFMCLSLEKRSVFNMNFDKSFKVNSKDINEMRGAKFKNQLNPQSAIQIL